MIVEVNSSNFGKVAYREGIVLVDCWAPWCRSCNDFAEAYNQASDRHPFHTFASLNTHDERELRESLEIRHLPSVMVFRDGVLLFKQAGNFDADSLDDIVEQAENVDMEMVRADLAATSSGSAA